MSLPLISPTDAKLLLSRGAIPIDVREADEHAREKIAGACNLPLSKLKEVDVFPGEGRPVVFYCRSGARTRGNASRLSDKVGLGGEAYLVEGGIDAWKKAGLPVVRDRRQPLELQRQAQIAAGSLTVAGTLLGLTLSPWFFAVPLFVGGGLLTAGITGFCGMAHLLIQMPWNQKAYRLRPGGV